MFIFNKIACLSDLLKTLQKSEGEYGYTHAELKQHVHAYLMAYNFAKRLKAIKGKTPWQFILNQWTIHLEYFIPNPNHFLLELNSRFPARS
ncbi:hypothetical protein [Holospora elegans]|uniref:hypothetical protein n=1 Tax=Holospora elegans TaxID=431043 RepID=UPI0019D3362B|nr:hypothetical protein [Holospora elegans]